MKKSWLVIASAAVAAAVAAYAYCNLALWLVVSDPLPPSLDAVFTFAGETARIIYSKELFSRYPRSQWLISYPSKKIAGPLGKKGLDTSRIYIVDTCRNTNSEAWYIAGWAKSKIADGGDYSAARPLAIGLVSTPFHMRRIRMEITRKYKGDRCRFYYLPVPYDRYGVTRHTYQTWWMYGPLRRAAFLEFQKFIYYFFTWDQP
ncbi:MAG TPA: hypothetical protein VLX68_13810 [Chitinivibrionales bacterium]|nr:hypothetical protein [Chitinivibrionales bacterium]